MRMSEVKALSAGFDRLTLWLRRQTPQYLSSSTVTALDRLATEGPLRVSELAALEAISQPGVTMLVHRMADAGYAERVPDPTDRRATLVRITEAGRKVHTDRQVARAQVLRERLAELSDEDQRLITDALPAIERLVGTYPSSRTSRT
jgi:DNA-binding MarR family transcriptional regulator